MRRNVINLDGIQNLVILSQNIHRVPEFIALLFIINIWSECLLLILGAVSSLLYLFYYNISFEKEYFITPV